jgi:peroxiredoxin
MKKSFFVLLLAVPVGLLAQTTGTFRITGRLKNIQAGWVYMLYVKNNKKALDSARVSNGAYVFSGDVTESLPATLLDVNPAGRIPAARSMARIYLTPESFTITHVDSFSNAVITGSVANTEFRKLQDAAKPYSEKEAVLLPRYRAAQAAQNGEAVKAIMQEAKGIESEMKEEVYGKYAKTHPHSPVAFYALEMYSTGETDVRKIQPLFDGLDNATRNSTAGKAFQEKLTAADKTSIGKQAMEFTQNDTLGKPVKLSSFRGKYVLLDFWASWCGPCRAENPSVVKAYHKYHAKGFDILSVSLDKPGDKAKWMQAIHDDQLAWTHVSDLQFWDNAAAKEYGIHSIPQNFLIDPQGKIVAKGLRGEELQEKLSTYLSGNTK